MLYRGVEERSFLRGGEACARFFERFAGPRREVTGEGSRVGEAPRDHHRVLDQLARLGLYRGRERVHQVFAQPGFGGVQRVQKWQRPPSGVEVWSVGLACDEARGAQQDGEATEEAGALLDKFSGGAPRALAPFIGQQKKDPSAFKLPTPTKFQ